MARGRTPSEAPHNEPYPVVMEKYNQEIEHLKTNIPQKQVNWSKIMRATQDSVESVHTCYGRLMQSYRQHSGVDDPTKEGVSELVSAFVLGMRPEISLHIEQSVMCWQAKSLDEILAYAKYCSHCCDAKKKTRRN